MESTTLNSPMIDPIRFQSKSHSISESSENSDPNLLKATPSRFSGTPLAKLTRSCKSKLNPRGKTVFSPRNRIRERRFVVLKKKKKTNPIRENNDSASVNSKCGGNNTNDNTNKCVCIAYGTLKDDFSVNPRETEAEQVNESDEIGEVSSMKRRREKVLEEARMNLPEFGKVMHLVKAFEKLNCFRLSKDKTIKKALKWELPGMSLKQPKCSEPDTEEEEEEATLSSSFSPSDMVLTAANLGLGQQPHALVSSSWDNSVSSINSNGGRRSRRNSLESSASMGSRRSKNKQIKVTSLKPFKLRTEERGRMKEEDLARKLQEMKMEEEKMRIPIAQGLPWTTDEPKSLVKPYVKDITRPIDLRLHSDYRALERAEFDYQVAEKINLMEQDKVERERRQKVAEEEELRRLRKELIPKAQPMPCFDRPFIPKRSNKHPTIPRDPKFNIPQHKKIRSSWSESGSYMSDLLYQQAL